MRESYLRMRARGKCFRTQDQPQRHSATRGQSCQSLLRADRCWRVPDSLRQIIRLRASVLARVQCGAFSRARAVPFRAVLCTATRSARNHTQMPWRPAVRTTNDHEVTGTDVATVPDEFSTLGPRPGDRRADKRWVSDSLHADPSHAGRGHQRRPSIANQRGQLGTARRLWGRPGESRKARKRRNAERMRVRGEQAEDDCGSQKPDRADSMAPTR